MEKYTYDKQLQDIRWKKKRDRIKSRDRFCCQICFNHSQTLNVHHRYYANYNDPWSYPDEALVTLCQECHEIESKERYKYEKRLTEVLKKHFFTPDLILLADAFEDMKKIQSSHLIALTLKWIIKDPKKLSSAVNKFTNNLKDYLARSEFEVNQLPLEGLSENEERDSTRNYIGSSNLQVAKEKVLPAL